MIPGSLMPVALLLTACAASSATAFPTLSPYALQTITAATAQAALAPTSWPARPIETLSPTPGGLTQAPPTFPPPPLLPGPPSAVDIAIPDGSTTRVILGNLLPGEIRNFVLAGEQGQAMLVAVRSTSEDTALSIRTSGGTSILSPTSRQTSWQGMLPITTEYYLGILGGSAPAEFSLSIELPIPIKFRVDEDTAIYSGKITDGNTAVYSLFTIPGQKIQVHLNGVGKLATLALIGFGEDVQYIKASDGETEFKLEPETLKDYVIRIVPTGDAVVNYTLVVVIKKP